MAAPLFPGLEGAVNWGGMLSQLVYWTGISLLGAALISVLAAVFYLLPYNYKVDVYPLYGSGKDGVFSIGQRKRNRIKWIKNKSAWKKLWPIFNRKEIEPFDDEYIYPGKQIYAFELNQEWIPGRLNVKTSDPRMSPSQAKQVEKDIRQYLMAVYGEDAIIETGSKKTWFQKVSSRIDKTSLIPMHIVVQSEGDVRAELNPVPYYIRNWQSLQAKKNAQEFATEGFWEENKNYIIMLATILGCLALVGATIYFHYQFATGSSADAKMVASAIKSITASAGGSAPV